MLILFAVSVTASAFGIRTFSKPLRVFAEIACSSISGGSANMRFAADFIASELNKDS